MPEVLKKQAGQNAAEYNRLADDYNEKTGTVSDKRKDWVLFANPLGRYLANWLVYLVLYATLFKYNPILLCKSNSAGRS